ncbi:MAG TPA: DNA-binding domain-containing protein [Thiobacillaceae bacterium]|nr:DNA-binding domain-containing protein [Thiobacillaceae bacterium]
MPTLLELQTEFAQALFDDSASSFNRLLRSDTLAAEHPLVVYRNNVRHNLTAALRDLYPVALRLTGEDWFRQAAHGYIDGHASRSPDLNDYGREFPEYLARLGIVGEELPYLPDSARLEWSVHEAFHAADAGPLDLERLARMPADGYGQLRFHLHPSCRLLQSEYPVHRIWQVNQPGYIGEEGVSLTEGGVDVLVFRDADYAISVEALDAAEFRFIAALQERQSLSATDDALPEGTDLGALLQGVVARGVVVDFSAEDCAR